MGRPSSFCLYSRNERPTICMMVLYLPHTDTLMRPRAPISAIHSRSADTAISRPMITTATMTMNQRRRHDQLVGDRIEERAEPRCLAPAPRQVAIQAIRDSGEREGAAGRRI